ncbi:uncharacterized protein [Miscanthus floridulus]|uniref:uncharacterized protein n=1 Tax=Miscanthus floridulus TaxID=154761 RepID=UPI00345991FE
MSSKRRAVGQDDDPRPSLRHCRRHRHAAGRRKHLYLVLDDWNNGFSIHKIDPDSLDDESPAGAGQGQQHLPEPPVLRLESPIGSVPHDRVSFSALGTKMLVFMNHRCALVYDTETAVVSIGPHAPARMLCGSGVTVPAGGMLYALSHRFFDKEDPSSFHVMQQEGGGWSWKTLPEPPPSFTSRQIVVSHALHPDGCTIFMTMADGGTPGEPLGTYSFNTERSEWRSHGDWALPFFGQGYFDSELDAWVGLHWEGYVCSCQVASRSRSSNSESSMILMTKEKLAYDYEDWTDRRGSASLTYMNMMGGTSKFCVVQTMMPDGVDDEDRDYCSARQLRFTMFGLKYDRSGELRITNRRSTRSFLLSRHRYNLFVPFALWI